MTSYMEAIRIAEEREAKVRAVFDKYDTDNSQTIDMEELLALLDDLGLLKNLKTNTVTFAEEMFVKYDANDDGVLSFEEFKLLYNAAIDDAKGKPKKKEVAARTANGLTGGTLEARKAIAQEKARQKAEEAERIRKQNAEMKARIMSKTKGADAKALDAELEAKRREMAEARARAKQEEADRLKKENRARMEKIKNQGAATVNKLSDEENELRAQAAERSAMEKAQHEAMLASQNKQQSMKLKNAGPAIDAALSEEENAARAAKAAQSANDKAQHEAMLAEQNRQQRMKIKSSGPAIDAALDEDTNALREEAKRRSEQEAAEAERKRLQAAQDLKLMKATTGSRTDHQLS